VKYSLFYFPHLTTSYCRPDSTKKKQKGHRFCANNPSALLAKSILSQYSYSMQREIKGTNDLYDMDDLFGGFRGFGNFGFHRSMMPSLFGGRDPFDDPFFTRPFGSMFESSMFGPRSASADRLQLDGEKGIVIEELNSDGEGEEDKGTEAEKYIHQKNSGSGKEPSVEHPDDNVDERDVDGVRNDHNRVVESQPQSHSVSFKTCQVTYGGVDGAYYTSTRTRRTGDDGVVVEESKEADKTTGQAAHRISRGINDKGHSVTRKLNSDGKVDTVQTLHNLKEDELAGFEETWKGNVKGNMHHWNRGFGMHSNSGSSSSEHNEKTWGGWLLPSKEQVRNAVDHEARTNSSGGRTKKVVRINIE
ncbi:hypothetical protein CFOL_v3_35588, partial [Cephalotus follicularis]